MSVEGKAFLERFRDFIEGLLALKVRETERVGVADDPLNVFSEEFSNNRPLVVAAVLALLLHIFLFLFMFPFFGRQVFIPTEEVLVLKQLALPSLPKGGGPPEPEIPQPKPKETVPKPTPVLVPIPDPTPYEPEPITRDEILDTPQILDEIAADLNIGDITAPPGRGQGVSGQGSGMSSGDGPAAGAGDGVYTLGSGVTNPIPVTQTVPSYTDEAIKAKAQGVVLLQAIIRKDGTVTDFKVLRGLGYGLEEKAIEEIATNWKFRPGTLNGRPVDVLATIEVQFNLR
ncbi:MAG: TonB family protein [Acidobacteriota bacterium]|nr:MAG: TonB family protein [Acidobacteriota bacterium]